MGGSGGNEQRAVIEDASASAEAQAAIAGPSRGRAILAVIGLLSSAPPLDAEADADADADEPA